VAQVKNSPEGTGFNAATEVYEDMIAAGIVDPAKVTRSALQNAASASAMLLTTEVGVTDVKEDVPAMPPMGGGMGNPMNGMPNAPLGNGSMSVSMSALGGMSNAPMSKGSMSGVMPTSSGGSMAVRLPQGGYMPSVVDDEFHEPVVPPQPRHGAGAGMRGSAGGYGRMPERPSEHSMPRVPDGMRRGAMSEHPSEHGMSRVSDGMRRGAMSGGEQEFCQEIESCEDINM
jgi:hypothetical protein